MKKLYVKSILKKDSKDIEYKIEKATETLERNIKFINNCDNKTSIVLTFIGVLFTIILTNNGFSTIFKTICNCFDEKTFCSVLYLSCFFVAVVILFMGLYNLWSVLIARTNINSEHMSKIFFSGIIKFGNVETYKEKFIKMNRQEFLDELIFEIYINSDIAAKKYKKYNTGLKLSIIGFFSFVVVLLIGIYIY